MLFRKYAVVSIVVLLWGVAAVHPAEAADLLTVTPSHLNVAATQGDRPERIVLLRATAPIDSFRFIPLDLPRADGLAVLPARIIQIPPRLDPVKPGEPLSVPVAFYLTRVPSGEFSGELLVNTSAGEVSIPLKVQVKDTWWPPLIVLVVGVALGTGVSAYRTRGKLRDELLVRLDRLRRQKEGDSKLVAPFKEALEMALEDVHSAIQSEQWAEGREAMDQGEALWTRWRKGRSDWVAQLEHADKLSARLKNGDPPANTPYGSALERILDNHKQSAPELEDPGKLRDLLEAVSDKINRYVPINGEIRRLQERLKHPPAERADQVATWKAALDDLETQLQELNPADDAAAQTLKEELDKNKVEIDNAIPTPPEHAQRIYGLTRTETETETETATGTGDGLIESAPLTRDVRPAVRNGDAARTRLRLFGYAGRLIALVLLAGGGFAELYVGKPTFGANPWADYFGLLAWGFGAEASRAAVMATARGAAATEEEGAQPS